MKISGFTFIKNGLTLGYPVKESIQSILPLCDEIVINVGFDDPDLLNDDGTYEYLRDNFIGDKFKFLKNYWDPKKTKDGLILSEQTNLAIAACTGDIGQYIQADELIHEDDLELLLQEYNNLFSNPKALGLIFQYIHFYGNVDIIKHTRNMYRREVRTIKLNSDIISWKDAQGFKLKDHSKITALLTQARIFHYGWARLEKIMDEKIKVMSSLYSDNKNNQRFKYVRQWGMKPFLGSHPKYLETWIKENKNPLDDIFKQKMEFPLSNIPIVLGDIIESWTNYRIGEYKNYRILS